MKTSEKSGYVKRSQRNWKRSNHCLWYLLL